MHPIRTYRILILLCLAAIMPGGSQSLYAQQPAITCYFNRPVTTSLSTGPQAGYLNGTFADTIAAYINRATQSIDVCLYNYTATSNSYVARIATAINAAAARGVQVRWIYNNVASTLNTGLSLVSSQVPRFSAPDLNGYIMHNKFMVIDVNAPDTNLAVVLTGSCNWSDQQTIFDDNNLIFIRSKQVALAFYREFNQMWGGTGPLPDSSAARFSRNKQRSQQTTFNVNGTLVEVYFSPRDSLGVQLEHTISTADHDLFFGIFAFTDFSISDSLKNKFNRGVQVRGIMDNWSNNTSAFSNLVPALGENVVIQSGSNDFHTKALIVDALQPASDPQVFSGSFNWTAAAQFSNDENTVIIHDAAIANQYYQAFCGDFTSLGGPPCEGSPCPAGQISITSNRRGSSYQWQADTGNGFVNLSNNSQYTGVNNLNLVLSNPPTNWYGYRYRCLVNGSQFSDTTTLTFTAYWNGTANSSWENPANWNCGSLPDANTDVVVNPGVRFFPQVNSPTACRSLRLSKGASARLADGINLILTGK